MNSWERETLERLKFKSTVFVGNFITGDVEVLPYNADTFKKHFDDKVKNVAQNEKINTFEYNVKKDLEQYVEHIKRFSRDFNLYY